MNTLSYVVRVNDYSFDDQNNKTVQRIIHGQGT